jgi:hypothetical protein
MPHRDPFADPSEAPVRTLLRRDTPVVALLVWTALVWLSRIRNILGNEDLDGGQKLVRLLIVAVFLGLAAMVVASWRRPARALWVKALSAWTIGLWTVQMVGILFDDHGVGFVLIHAALAAVSITLAGLAWRSQRRAAAVPRIGATL